MKSDYQNEIVGRVRLLRMQFGYSQADIAALLNVSNGQIGNIESLKSPHKYTLKQLFIICCEFKYPIEQLFVTDDDYLENIDIVK